MKNISECDFLRFCFEHRHWFVFKRFCDMITFRFTTMLIIFTSSKTVTRPGPDIFFYYFPPANDKIHWKYTRRVTDYNDNAGPATAAVGYHPVIYSKLSTLLPLRLRHSDRRNVFSPFSRSLNDRRSFQSRLVLVNNRFQNFLLSSQNFVPRKMNSKLIITRVRWTWITVTNRLWRYN